MQREPTFGSPLHDSELWRHAVDEVKRFGHLGALMVAKARIRAFEVLGDVEGSATLAAISYRVIELAPAHPEPTLH